VAVFERSREQREWLALNQFAQVDLVERGHFVLTSGEHSQYYVRKETIAADPFLLAMVTRLMAEDIAETFDPDQIDVLVGAAPCAAILATRTAEHLGDIWKRPPQVAFVEKVTDARMSHNVKVGYYHEVSERLVLKRGQKKRVAGRSVHILEDAVHTGGSIVEVRELVEKVGAVVTGASAAWSRKPVAVTAEALGVPEWLPLVSRELPAHAKYQCPMDADLEAHPIRTDVGHGQHWLEEQAERSAATVISG
jgi:orotate phosphoribosyltransferase